MSAPGPLAILYYSNLMPGGQLANRLQDLGYRVQTLGHVSDLTKVCQQEKPMVVVAEILAGGPSCASIAKMKKDPSTMHIPVLGYTAAHEPALVQKAAESGVSLLVGLAAVTDHLPRLLDQILQIE